MPAPFDLFRQTISEAARLDLSHPVSPARARAARHVPVIISVMKNELSILPDFLAHHRELGAERFVILDNGSTDGSLEYCAAQGDVELHLVERPFHWPQKQGWITRVIAEHGFDRWYIYLDGDERLTFDGAPGRGLGDLADWAQGQGLRRVRGMLIDMYAPGPLLQFDWDGRAPLAEAFPLFDSDSYQQFRYEMIIARKGGPRPRKLSNGDPGFRPEMTKYPLFRPRPGDVMDNPHHISPEAENFASDCMIGLLHFKFLPGFVAKAKQAIREASYFSGSAEYRAYLEALARDPDLTLDYDGSQRFEGPQSLVAAELIAAIDWADLPARPLCHARRLARRQLLQEAARRHA